MLEDVPSDLNNLWKLDISSLSDIIHIYDRNSNALKKKVSAL